MNFGDQGLCEGLCFTKPPAHSACGAPRAVKVGSYFYGIPIAVKISTLPLTALLWYTDPGIVLRHYLGRFLFTETFLHCQIACIHSLMESLSYDNRRMFARTFIALFEKYQ